MWTNVASVTATTPLTTFELFPVPTQGTFQIVQVFSYQPVLAIELWTGNRVRISWSTAYPGYTLQSKLGLFGVWAPAGLAVNVVGNRYIAYDNIGAVPKYYRLIK
jgi:hypothetical protein